ncbi:hypothetical protein A2U01_0024758, partial [Trifolium medium]|nr:hypothetical protein [Trifolium medium]
EVSRLARTLAAASLGLAACRFDTGTLGLSRCSVAVARLSKASGHDFIICSFD